MRKTKLRRRLELSRITVRQLAEAAGAFNSQQQCSGTDNSCEPICATISVGVCRRENTNLVCA